MENELKIFDNEEFGKVRAIEVNGEGWLIGKDVVENLGYDTSSNSYSFYINKFVDEEDKLKCDSQSSFGIDYKQLGQRGGILINESGLYSLVMSSKLPTAKKFKRWVTSEVLPSIRKHGAYLTPYTLEKVMGDPEFLIGLLSNLKEEQDARKLLESKLKEAQPLIDFAKTVSDSKDNISMGEMAKLCSTDEYIIGRNRLFELLRKEKILMKDNIPYQRLVDNGWFKVIETIKYGNVFLKTMVTGKGQLKVLELVKESEEN